MPRTTDTKPEVILAKDMRLGDYVSMVNMTEGLFSTSIVIKATEEAVTLWRPYGTTADFSYTGGVIPYVGIETYEVIRTSSVQYTRLRKSELK